MPSIADRVKETTTTTGTGTVSLDGAVTGFRAFSSAFTSGTVVYYCITDGTNWEVGYGAATTGTPWTLARSTVLASSNAGSLVSFGAGTKDVFCTAPAAEIDIHAATSKTTPVDADEIPIADSAATFGLKKLTWANLKATFIATVQTWAKAQIGGVTALSVSANAVAVDLSLTNNFSLTLQATTAQTLSNPTNIVAGQSGQIAITQNATPSTLAYGAYWKFLDGVTPAVSTTASAKNILSYYVQDSTTIWCSLNKGGVA